MRVCLLTTNHIKICLLATNHFKVCLLATNRFKVCLLATNHMSMFLLYRFSKGVQYSSLWLCEWAGQLWRLHSNWWFSSAWELSLSFLVSKTFSAHSSCFNYYWLVFILFKFIIIISHIISRHIKGIDFENLSYRVYRAGASQSYVPMITGRLEVDVPGFLAEEWAQAQALSAVPIKACFPGPYTIIHMLSVCKSEIK